MHCCVPQLIQRRKQDSKRSKFIKTDTLTIQQWSCNKCSAQLESPFYWTTCEPTAMSLPSTTWRRSSSRHRQLQRYDKRSLTLQLNTQDCICKILNNLHKNMIRINITRALKESALAAETFDPSFSSSKGRENFANNGDAAKHSSRSATNCSFVTASGLSDG